MFFRLGGREGSIARYDTFLSATTFPPSATYVNCTLMASATLTASSDRSLNPASEMMTKLSGRTSDRVPGLGRRRRFLRGSLFTFVVVLA
jgi:hypothetical protein